MVVSFLVFTILIFGATEGASNAWALWVTCLIFSNLIPIATVLYLKHRGIISDLDASLKEQRTLPLTLGVIYAGLGFLTLYYQDAPPLVQGLMFCYMTNTLVILIITRYWKISIHVMGVAGPLTALWLFGWHFPLLILGVVILVSSARVILDAHTIAQVAAGALLGWLLTWGQLNLWFV
jgi:membrane-associated phospholipid phosphatase